MSGREIIARSPDAGMPHSRVTLLTQQWRTPRQHRRIVRTMRLVAEGTVLGNRGMLPQEWTAHLRMTLKAILIDCRARQHGVIEPTMGLMTVSASHLPKANRVPVGSMDFGTLLDVTVHADLQLCRCHHHGITPRMYGVTIGACDILYLVNPPVPGMLLLSVATETCFVFPHRGPR